MCVTNDNGHAPSVVITIGYFPHSWLITGNTTGATRRNRKCLTVRSTRVHPRFLVVFVLLAL